MYTRISMKAPPSPVTSMKRRTVWTRPALLTAAALVTGLTIQAASLAAPRWAAGQTYHLASSSAFQVDLATGLWGYCTSAKTDMLASTNAVKEHCVAFHSTIGRQELTVCEAYGRGFVYGTDDVRGVRFPGDASEDVHRIQRPPTSLDDVHIERFIEKSCGVEGTATLTLFFVSLLMALCTLVSFVWTLGKPRPLFHETSTNIARSNASLLQFSSVASFATVVLWLHQSADLRKSDERVSIYVGESVYTQLVVALLYCAAGMGILATDSDNARRGRSILKM